MDETLTLIFICAGLMGGLLFVVRSAFEWFIRDVNPFTGRPDTPDITEPDEVKAEDDDLIDDLAAIMMTTFGKDALRAVVVDQKTVLHADVDLWREVALRIIEAQNMKAALDEDES